MGRRASGLIVVIAALALAGAVTAQRLGAFPAGGGAAPGAGEQPPGEVQHQAPEQAGDIEAAPGAGEQPPGEDVVAQAKQALQEDQRLARHQGPLGPFVIGSSWRDWPACDKPGRPPDELVRSSELYHPLLERALMPDAYSPEGVVGCLSPEVRVDSVGAYLPNTAGGLGYMFRSYFVGEARVAVKAPLERLRLEEIAGHPALVVVPVKGALVDDAIVIAIERMPDGDRPGIMVGAHVVQDLELARRVVEQLLRKE